MNFFIIVFFPVIWQIRIISEERKMAAWKASQASLDHLYFGVTDSDELFLSSTINRHKGLWSVSGLYEP